MNVMLAVAAALSVAAAGIHSGVGEVIVLRRLPTEHLAPTRFGGTAVTKLLIRVTWHIVGATFLAIGIALAMCAAPGAHACAGVGFLAAASFVGFAMVAIVETSRLGVRRIPRMFLRHPAPLAFVVIALLAWFGVR